MAITKKATTRKTTTVSRKRPAVTAVAKPTEKTTTSPVITPTPVAVSVKKSNMFIIVAILGIGALLFYFKSLFVVAIVNGQPISRMSVVSQLEKQGGKQVLNISVTKMLIDQEAKKKNVTVAQSDIDAELKKTETSLASQGQTLDQALSVQGMTRAEYADQVRLQLLIQKMVGKDIVISDKEVNDYIETNKASIPEGSNMDQIKKSVRDQLKQQKLSTKIQTWIGELQKNAKITYFLNY